MKSKQFYTSPQSQPSLHQHLQPDNYITASPHSTTLLHTFILHTNYNMNKWKNEKIKNKKHQNQKNTIYTWPAYLNKTSKEKRKNENNLDIYIQLHLHLFIILIFITTSHYTKLQILFYPTLYLTLLHYIFNTSIYS